MNHEAQMLLPLTIVIILIQIFDLGMLTILWECDINQDFEDRVLMQIQNTVHV